MCRHRRAQWGHNHVTADKNCCVYIADDEQAVREHARYGGFPASFLAGVHAVIDTRPGRDFDTFTAIEEWAG